MAKEYKRYDRNGNYRGKTVVDEQRNDQPEASPRGLWQAVVYCLFAFAFFAIWLITGC
jgi:hypothetical protein